MRGHENDVSPELFDLLFLAVRRAGADGFRSGDERQMRQKILDWICGQVHLRVLRKFLWVSVRFTVEQVLRIHAAIEEKELV